MANSNFRASPKRNEFSLNGKMSALAEDPGPLTLPNLWTPDQNLDFRQCY
jgi:hypothetical protein